MKKRMEIREKITEIIREMIESGQALECLGDNIDLSKEYMFDSIMIIELISRIEDMFDIEFEFDDLDIEKVYLFGELVRIVERQRG